MTGRLKLGAQAVAVAAVAALLALLVWKVAFGADAEVTNALRAGETPPAPEFTLERLDGEGELALASLRGKVVVLNWWATWCIPCREEMPLLQDGWERWRDRDVVFVGVNVESFRDDARDFLDEYGVTYPNVRDTKKWTIGRYGVTGYPETYVVDADGDVVYRIAGPVLEDEDLDDAIELALRSA